LPNHTRNGVSAIGSFYFVEEVSSSGFSDGSEIGLEMLFGHTNTSITNVEDVVVRVGSNFDCEFVGGIESRSVSEREETDLVESIGRVGNQFSEKDVFVFIKRVNNQFHHSVCLSTWLFNFHVSSHFPYG
jgi:hypothetical protein